MPDGTAQATKGQNTNRLLIPALSAANFVIGMGAFVVVGVLEPLGASLGVSNAQAGTLMTVYAIAYAVLSPLLVAATGHIGRRRVLTLGLALFTVSMLLTAFAPSLGWVNAARILAAAGAGMFTPVAAAVAASLYPPEVRAKVLAAVFFGLTIAQVAGVPAGSFIAYTFGWRWTFICVLVLALPCLVLLWRQVPAGLTFEPVSLSDLKGMLGQPRLLLAIFFTGTFLGAIYVPYTFIAPLLSEMMGYERAGISATLAVFGIGAVIGNILGGIMADRIGWKITLSLLCLCQMAIMPFYSFLPFEPGAVVVLFLVWSICGWSFMAGQQMRLITLAGARAPVVLAMNAAAIYVGAAIGSAVGAGVMTRYGVDALGIAGGIAASFALANLLLSIKLEPEAQA
jgi:predicted MFS family arabinose efflux permease